jgi:hypothetical protein
VSGKRVTSEELQAWLLKQGYAEEERGHGHVTAEVLADALLDKYSIRYEEWDS